MPTPSGRKVLLTGTHSVGGSVQMPNGATDYGRIGLGATGPGWCATTTLGVTCDSCSATFASYGPESHVFPNNVTATVQLGTGFGAAQASLDFNDAPGPYRGIDSPGRGAFGDTISGSYSFSVPSELVLYTYGEELPDDAIPDDAYPDYGGARIVGEFPSNYGIMVWEPVAGSSVTGSVTFGGRTASCTASSESCAFSDYASYAISLDQSPGVGGDSGNYRPGGTIAASLNLNGYPIETGGASAYYEFASGGGVACQANVGAGSVSVSMNTFSEGVPSGNIGGITAGGTIRPTRRGQLLLDAVAMDSPYPSAPTWRVLRKWLGVIPVGPGEEYGTIVDPPQPIWESLVGQSVSATIEQRYESISITVYNKSVGPKHRTGGTPAQGYLNGRFVQFDHYRNDRGRVMGYVVPPEGEHPNDWRVGWLGRAQDALTVGHSASIEVTVPSGSEHDGGTFYDLDGLVAEGYRYAEVASDGTILTTGSKAWSLSGDDSTTQLVDLCFPDANGGSGAGDHDSQDTRWPLDEKRKSTVNTPYWGVSVLDALTVTGGSLASLSLKRIAGPKMHFLAPFVPASWEKEVPDDVLHTSDGDEYTVEHYCARLAIGDVDGRQGIEIPHVRRTDNNAPNRRYVSDYAHLTVSSLPAFFAEVPGWLASSASSDAGDLPAWFMGLGFVRQGGSWTKSYDRNTGTFKAQPRYDSMEWPGDVASDVLQVGGGGQFTLVGRKPFRGAAYGSTKNETTVRASDVTAGSELGENTVQKRYGPLGPTLSVPNDWGLVWVDPAHKASVGGLPRRIQRVAFGVAPKGGKILGFFARPDGRLIRIVDQGGTAHIGLSDVPGRANWDERDLGPAATDASVHRGIGARNVLALVTDGVLNLTIDASEGRQPPTMSVSDGNATSGDLCAFGEGLILVARIDGGTLKTTLRNASDLSYVDGPFTTGVTGLPDDAVVRVDDVRLEGNRPGVAALIVANGTTTSYLSDDGKTFT